MIFVFYDTKLISMALLRDGLMLYDVSILAIKQEDCYDTHAV